MDDERKMVRKEVILEYGSAEWTLAEFMGLLNTVPPEYRDAARVEFETPWGDSCSSLTVYYERPETDDELSKRLQRARTYEETHEAFERSLYESLKAKFG